MKRAVTLFVALVVLAWGLNLASPEHPSAPSLAWTIYDEGLYLTGLLSIALLSLAMVLAARPAWLERPLGGMDGIFRLHKWSGILGMLFGTLHWLWEMSDDIVKALFGRAGRGPKEGLSAFPEGVRDLGEWLGEWGFYILVAMVALTLWKQFPYRLWNVLHRTMPVLYAMVVIHAVVLAPSDYWNQPVGALLAALFAGAIVAGVLSLSGRIGRARQVEGEIVSVTNPSPEITEVTCRLAQRWHGHRAGQFAFVTFDSSEGAHPFTIASADRGDRTVTFAIKALGDYTRGLAHRLRVGQPVTVEGPYGRFHLSRRRPRDTQIWIAGGIGITPFLAWLEFLRDHPDKAPAVELHYCISDRENDPFVPRLEALCAAVPGVRLLVHASKQGDRLSAEELAAAHADERRMEVWYCGPRGLAEKLQGGLQRLGRQVRFHREAFELR